MALWFQILCLVLTYTCVEPQEQEQKDHKEMYKCREHAGRYRRSLFDHGVSSVQLTKFIGRAVEASSDVLTKSKAITDNMNTATLALAARLPVTVSASISCI